MGRWRKLVLLFTAFIPSTSAQITNGGYYGYGSASLPELLSQVFGIRVSEPYHVLGILATFSVMWVSAYVIFKIALQYLDKNLEDSNMDTPFQDAVGLTDDDSRNVLAVLTLLITLTVVGSAGFTGLIRGWQSMILLAFTFMILAGTLFILIGGVGGTIAGSAYITGASVKATSSGVGQMVEGIEATKEALDRAETEEEQIEEEEAREEDEIDEGEEEEADEEAETTARELEQVIRILSDAEDEINELMDEEIDELEEDIDRIRRIINLLGESDE
ncbi:hypothetical protein ACK3SF_03485 [Candidatus Nanosalina sp. VS9-1]|uniref:hypothetical protein n=1 Tax=Candidatus Nanosalina sp. VS9-1 TaxID=3388566 RepID=UPI0039E07E91